MGGDTLKWFKVEIPITGVLEVQVEASDANHAMQRVANREGSVINMALRSTQYHNITYATDVTEY